MYVCGERACPALGREAALKSDALFLTGKSVALLGPLRSPARGKPAHHNSPLTTTSLFTKTNLLTTGVDVNQRY